MAGGIGQQFDFDQYPTALRGGMRAFPQGGVLSGVTLGAITHNGTTDVLSIAGVGGDVRVDGKRFTLANGTINIPVEAPASGSVELSYDIYVRPVRKVKVYTSIPGPGVGVNGDKAFYAAEFRNHYEIQEVLIKYEGAWIPYNEFRSGYSFAEVGDAYREPPSTDHWQLPFNEITGVEWALEPEKIIYHKRSAYPAFASAPGPCIARIDASLHRASVRLSLNSASAVTILEAKVNPLYIPV